MRILITTAMFSALAFTPASAAMMACTGENMAKTTTMMTSMPDGPGKMGMGKEMGMANTEMSKGNAFVGQSVSNGTNFCVLRCNGTRCRAMS